MSEQLDLLKLLASRLEKAGIPYMITGSVAVNYYAEPRMTRDVDVVVELSPGDAVRVGELFGQDFYIDREIMATAIEDRGIFNLIHLEYVIKVDCIVRRESAYRRLEFSRRRPIEIEGTTLYIVSPEDLLLSKLDWTREAESELQFRDVRNLIESVQKLDWSYIHEWAATLGLESLLKRCTS